MAPSNPCKNHATHSITAVPHIPTSVAAAGGSRLPIIVEGAYPATGGTGAAGPPTTAATTAAAATGAPPAAIGAGSGRRRRPGRSVGTTPTRRSPGYRRASKSKGECECVCLSRYKAFCTVPSCEMDMILFFWAFTRLSRYTIDIRHHICDSN